MTSNRFTGFGDIDGHHWLAKGLVVLLAFVAARSLMWLITVLAGCEGGLGPECLGRWDSGLYLDIARQGHTLFPCPDGAEKWCGNAGWAPLYPWLVRWLAFAGWPGGVEQTGVFLSAIFLLASLLVLAWACRVHPTRLLFLCAVVIIAPGAAYLHAVFPLSQVVFFLFLLLAGLDRQLRWLVWIGAAGAVLSYSVGFFLVAALALSLVIDWWLQGRSEFRPWISQPANRLRLEALAFSAATFAGLLVYDFLVTGHWDAMFLVQAKYGHQLDFPLRYLPHHGYRLLRDLGEWKAFVEIQHFSVWVALAFAWFSHWRDWRRPDQSIVRLCLVAVTLFWAVTYGASLDISLYRSVLLGLPFWVFLFYRQPRRYQYLWLPVFGACHVPMGVLFVQGALV